MWKKVLSQNSGESSWGKELKSLRRLLICLLRKGGLRKAFTTERSCENKRRKISNLAVYGTADGKTRTLKCCCRRLLRQIPLTTYIIGCLREFSLNTRGIIYFGCSKFFHRQHHGFSICLLRKWVLGSIH